VRLFGKGRAPEALPDLKVVFLYALVSGSHRSMTVTYHDRTAQDVLQSLEKDRKADRMVVFGPNSDNPQAIRARDIFHIDIKRA